MAVHDLRESATSKATKLHEEMSTMVDSTTNVKAEWTLHVEKTESQYIEDTSAVETGKKDLEEVLQCWYLLSFPWINYLVARDKHIYKSLKSFSEMS